MAPGSWNSKNYGGLHTGTGKYQKGGAYSNNGHRYKTLANHNFKQGTEVKYMGRHKDFVNKKGCVISKDGDIHRSGRSIIKVELTNNRVCYIHKNNLQLV